MADDDWDKREDFEILPKPVAAVRTDKWEGEDEDDVKDNWDDEEAAEAALVESDDKPKAVQVKKKKKIADLLAEKEAARLAELELSPEELAAHKLRAQKLMEDAEIQSVKEAFGSSAVCDSDPVTKDDFDALRKRIMKELLPFEKRAPYPDFVEELIQDLALALPAKRLRKVKTTVEALYFEKTKAEKIATKGTTGGKAPKTKVKLNVEGDRAILKGGLDDALDEFDDFM